ncbi:MAG: hypothetical protein P8011_18120 [Acidihalobacter sp.]
MSLSLPRARITIIALAGLVLITFAFWWFILRAIAVPVALTNSGRLPMQVHGPGTLQARIATTVAARVSGRIYQGNVADGVWLIDNTGSQLWVVENGRGGPFNEQSRMPQDSYRSVAAIPGVAKAAPFITYNVQRRVGDRERQFTIIGYDVFDGLGGPRRLVAGRPLQAAGVVASFAQVLREIGYAGAMPYSE